MHYILYNFIWCDILISKLDHLNLSVHDFDETVAWYNKIFCFTVVEEGVDDGLKWGVIQCNDAMLCIYEAPELIHADRFKMKEKGVHYLAHFGLRVTDKESWEKKIKEEKLPILYDGVVHWPNSLAWYIKDPTGWEIEVVYWQDDIIRF